MGVLLMLMTIGGLFAAFVLLAFSLLSGKAWLRNFVFGGVTIWLVFYAMMLVGFSLLSEEKTLAPNEAKEFCGFYLDCHLHTAVTAVRKTKTIGDKTAKGEFYIVKVNVFSNAKNPSVATRLVGPTASVQDEAGNIYLRDTEAESFLPTAEISLNRDVKKNISFDKEMVFDLPVNVTRPRLDISEGWAIDKAIETVLIGDEDSILHKRKLFDLAAFEIAVK